MEKIIEKATAIGSEVQSLETSKVASAAHDLYGSAATEFDSSKSDGEESLTQQRIQTLRERIHTLNLHLHAIENGVGELTTKEQRDDYMSKIEILKTLKKTLRGLLSEGKEGTHKPSSRRVNRVTKKLAHLALSSSSDTSSQEYSSEDESSDYSETPGSLPSDYEYKFDKHHKNKSHFVPYDGIVYKKDKIGSYIPFVDRRNRKKRYYIELVDKDLGFRLSTLEDFPKWCNAIGKYSRRYGLDDIVKMKPYERLHPTENMLVHRLLEGAVDLSLRRYFHDDSNVVKSFNYIKRDYLSRHPVDQRDAEWSSLTIDSSCPRIHVADQVLTKLVYSEIYGNADETKYRRDNHFINKRILHTLTKDLKHQVKYREPDLLAKKYGRIDPMDLVHMIISQLHEESELDSGMNSPCNYCKSYLHITESCKKGKRGSYPPRQDLHQVTSNQRSVNQRDRNNARSHESRSKINKSGPEAGKVSE